MHWIKAYTASSYKIFAGNVVEGFQPLDFFHFYPLWHDLWMTRLAGAIRSLDIENAPYADVKDLVPVPSSMRAQLQKIIPSYHVSRKNKEDFSLVTNFFARLLSEASPMDPFANTTNRVHSDTEVKKILSGPWTPGAVPEARQIGRLITTIGSFGHGLYSDLGVDFCWDAYGPYDVQHGGEPHALLIRHFPNLAPKELWDAEFMPSAEDVRIEALYQNVEWVIPFVGCHASPAKGSIVEGLRKYRITADGKNVDANRLRELIEEFSIKAESLYKKIRALSFEELKMKVMFQECYQLKRLLEAAGLSWEPTDAMKKRIEGVPLLTEVVPHGVLMTEIEQYVKAFGLRDFAKEVLQTDL